MDREELDLSILDPGAGYLDFPGEDVFPDFVLPTGTARPSGIRHSRRAKREQRISYCQPEEAREASVSGTCKALRVGGTWRGPKSKACREKARRERINERFQELAKLCDPEEPKTDKASILSEGIKLITQLKLENGQLRQLNKYLEERIGHNEKEKGQMLYHQSLMLQGQFPPAIQPMLQQPALECPQQGYQVAMGMPNPGMLGSPQADTSAMPSVGRSIKPSHPTATQAATGTVFGTPATASASSSQPDTSAQFAAVSTLMPFMNTHQDHRLRPPAA